MSKKYNVGINQENYFQFSCGFSFLYKRDTERELKIKIHKKNCSTCILRNATREIVEIKDSSLKPELNNYLSMGHTLILRFRRDKNTHSMNDLELDIL